MSKARVHELAKKYDVTSKEIIEKLESIKEYVKSASSTVEAPVVKKLEKAFPELAAAAAAAPKEEPAKRLLQRRQRQRKLPKFPLKLVKRLLSKR